MLLLNERHSTVALGTMVSPWQDREGSKNGGPLGMDFHSLIGMVVNKRKYNTVTMTQAAAAVQRGETRRQNCPPVISPAFLNLRVDKVWQWSVVSGHAVTPWYSTIFIHDRPW
jgi:hypothetical protein